MPKTIEQRFLDREFVEKLERVSSFLPESDRILFTQRVVNGMTLKDLALLTGKSADRISGEVKRIIDRLQHPGFRFVVLYGEHLDPDILKIAKAIHIHGLSIRDASDLIGLPFHQVREGKKAIGHLIQFEARKP